VRAREEGLSVVVVEAQERVLVHGGLARGVGADGEVRWEAAVAAAPTAGAWYEAGRVALDAPGWAALAVAPLDWPRLVVGVQRHVAGLVAAGWGEAVVQVVDWFVDPLAGATCIVPALYHVREGCGVLAGFEGMLLRPLPVQVDDDGQALFGEMWADVVGVGLPRLEVPRADFVRDLLMGAVPIDA
jgi:hypothetical protein